MQLLTELASSLSQADVPLVIVSALRLRRATALLKRDNGVRGNVMGDFFRRLKARTLAQQLQGTPKKRRLHSSTLWKPVPCASAWRTCCRLTDLDENATVVSVDGLGAHDLLSKNSMLSSPMDMKDGEQLLPFARIFYGDLSTHLWEDEVGDVHLIHQGEGREQSDALMLMWFRLGQHGALMAISDRLLPEERLFAYLDDLHVARQPARVAEVHT